MTKSLEVLKREAESLYALCEAGHDLKDILAKTKEKIAMLESKIETEAEKVKREGRA